MVISMEGGNVGIQANETLIAISTFLSPRVWKAISYQSSVSAANFSVSPKVRSLTDFLLSGPVF